MRLRLVILLACSLIFLYLFNSCKHKPFPAPTTEYGNFPENVGYIFVTKCGVTGCHDAAGAENAGKLRLDSWDKLFKGSSHGSVVIPYNTAYSSLLYYINTDSSRGIVAVPTMPYELTPLSADEYYIIKNWIAAGAPDKDGNIPFASNSDTRQKIYITQQGCDLMAVIDAESKLMMRLFPIGVNPNTESPHNVRVTGDGSYAYVSFMYSGSAVQKIDARKDTVVSTVSLGTGSGGVVSISPDGQKVIVADLTYGQLISVDFSTMGITMTGPGSFKNPHGIANTPNWDTFFVTSQYGNTIYRYVPGKVPPVKKIPIDTTQPAVESNPGNIYGDPHEILMTPDHSKLFVTCQTTNKVFAIDAHTYQTLAVFNVGAFPQEMAIALSKHELYVSCMEDANPKPGRKGSVYVIDYNTLQLGTTIYGDFYQPHGIAVDERNNLLLIVSSNVSGTGPPPHHVSSCGDKAGWYSAYDLNTLQPINNYRYSTTNAPYSADTRFK